MPYDTDSIGHVSIGTVLLLLSALAEFLEAMKLQVSSLRVHATPKL